MTLAPDRHPDEVLDADLLPGELLKSVVGDAVEAA